MRILHTSDWHLGKKLKDRSRLPEQREVLGELIEVCRENEVDVVLVAGDVFDTFLPPAEAEEVFYGALKELADGRAVVIVAGNHDDAVRLNAAAPLAAEHGIYLMGDRVPPIGGDLPVHAVAAGERYLILENGRGEKLYINALPYPNEARSREEKSEESYGERVQRKIEAGMEAYDGSMPFVLLSHLFVQGGLISESERDVSLGGARVVPAEVFPKGGYVALGHLHRPQSITPNVVYSGSLLQYSFDEANTEKVFVLLETRGKEIVRLKDIPISSGKRLARLEANGVGNALPLLRMHAGKFVELTLTLSGPLTREETKSLYEANEGLVSLITRVAETEAVPVVRRSEMSAADLFTAFYRAEYSADPSEELKTTFLALLEENV